MEKIFILAGTHEQFRCAVRQLENAMFAEGIAFRHHDFIYLTADSIRGCRNVWGYKYGTWRQRDDLHIIEQLALVCGSSIEQEFMELSV